MKKNLEDCVVKVTKLDTRIAHVVRETDEKIEISQTRIKILMSQLEDSLKEQIRIPTI